MIDYNFSGENLKMEITGALSINYRNILINSYIDEYFNKFIQSKTEDGELVLPALNEMPLSGFVLTAGFGFRSE